MANFSDADFTVREAEVLVDSNGHHNTTYTAIQLQWLIRVQGFFDDDGFHLVHVTPGGPATQLTSVQGGLAGAAEVGDTITSINDQAILNGKDWAIAMANAPDHNKVKLSIVDVESGDSVDWFVKPQTRPGLVVPPPTPSGQQAHFPIQTPEAKQKVGETTATASAKISKQPTKGLIELHVHVKKTGVAGSGTACGQVALLDKDNNTVFQTGVTQKTKGANANPLNNPGVAEDDADGSYDVPLTILNIVQNAAVMARASDSDGFPGSLDEFNQGLDKIKHALDTAVAIAEDVAVIVAIASA